MIQTNKNSIKGPRITVENLSLSFGKNTVLNAIDFCANPGEIHCIIGPNGGGKSTLIKSLLGQMHHKGQIKFDWADKPGITGYVPQVVTIDQTLPINVYDFIALCIQQRPAFLGIRKDLKKRVDELLEMLSMGKKGKYIFSELSGGERQRVLFAQALIPQPQLLILDEPMNSIDKSGAEVFSKLIRGLRDQGVTIIWIHHDLADVRKHADVVTCINRSLLFSGNPADVMDEKHLLEIFSAQRVIDEE